MAKTSAAPRINDHDFVLEVIDAEPVRAAATPEQQVVDAGTVRPAAQTPPDRATPTRQALHDALVELENEAADVVLAALSPVLGRAADRLSADVVTAASVDGLTSIVDDWGDAVDASVLPHYRRVFELGGYSAVEQMILLGVDQAAIEAVAQPYLAEAASRHLARARDRFLRVGDRAWREARLVLLDGLDHGRGIDEIAGNLRQVVDVSAAEARMVARTEVVGAANAGAQAQAEAVPSEAPLYKQWLATDDRRTRPTHWAADGSVVELKAPFMVGGARLRHPGDPAGPDEEIKNCRCTVLYTDDPAGFDVNEEGRGQGGVLADVADEVEPPDTAA